MERFRQEFAKADTDKSGKLEAAEMRQFLRAVLGEELTARDDEGIAALMHARGTTALTLDEAMLVIFPHHQRDIDPRLLTIEEAEMSDNTAQLVRMQLSKMESFMEAAMQLSPAQLHRLHVAHQNMSEGADEFLAIVRTAANDHARTVEAAMCRGLTCSELEGLRCAWVQLHPALDGPLTEREIELHYAQTHEGRPMVSRDHFVRWKKQLDVRGTGRIEWPEFCYPFAQRALLKTAEDMLKEHGREIAGGSGLTLLTRSDVEEQFGVIYVEQCFLPHEMAIPIARVLAATLAADSERPLR